MKNIYHVKQMYRQKNSNIGTPVREVPLFSVSCKENVDYIGFLPNVNLIVIGHYRLSS